jgi:hypothetical protein
MSGTRALTITGAVVATIVGVFAFMLIPASIAVGHPTSAVVEAAILVVCVWYVWRVMREDRRRRLAREALLPAVQRPQRRQPRRPITFQLRETAITFAIWFALVFAFDAFALEMEPILNIGVSFFAGFMLATLTVTGRHMMFRLTAEEDEAAGEGDRT